MTICPECHINNRSGARFCANCGASLAGLQPGQVMHGQYTIVRQLGKGGMGAVYLATETIANEPRSVVIKEMLDYYDPDDPQGEAKARQRFKVEAATLVKLNCYGIPLIFAYFIENGRNYIVMQFIQGRNLETGLTHEDDNGYLVAGQPYPVDQVRAWGNQVCEVLEYLAKQNIVHMDIKPANLIVDDSGRVWLVDFGTARAQRVLPRGAAVGLQKSSIFGTAGYAPPEQYQGQAHPPSDVYALAATLYHLLTDDDPRAHPFDFPQLKQLPADLASALQQALANDATQRLTAARFRQQLTVRPATGPIFRWQDGTACRDPTELVRPADHHWDEARGYFNGGDWENWFKTLHRNDLLAQLARVKSQHHRPDVALDALLRLLDPTFLPPRLQVSPARLDLGNLPRGDNRTLTLDVINAGQGYMPVVVSSAAPWLKVSPAQFGCLSGSGRKQTIRVEVSTNSLATGQSHTVSVTFQAGAGGTQAIPVALAVPAPVLQVKPTYLDFGAIYRGQRVEPRQVQVSNEGDSYLEATLSTSAVWLRVQPDRVRCEPGQTVTVQIEANTNSLSLRQQHQTTVEVITPDAGRSQVQARVTTSVGRELMRWLMDTGEGHRMLTFLALVLTFLALSLVFLGVRVYQAVHYAAGMQQMQAGQWTEARVEFVQVKALLPFYDTEEQIKESYYRAGLAFMAAGEWSLARTEFEPLMAIDMHYRDTQEQIKESYYQVGWAYMAAGEWAVARAELEQLVAIDGSYKDVQEQIKESYYQPGLAFIAVGEWELAQAELEQLIAISGSYKDAQEQLKECYYQAGLAYLAAEKCELAQVEFEKLMVIDESYKDAQEQLKECYYQAGVPFSMDGYWDFRVHVYRDTSNLNVDQNYQILATLTHNDPHLVGELLEATGNACSKARISGTVEGYQVTWIIHYTGSCCRDAEMQFEGNVNIDGTMMEGNLTPIGTPPPNCELWWAELIATKR